MDTSLNLNAAAPVLAPATPTSERANTTRVAKIEGSDAGATLPSDKPFVAQVVSARLDGAAFPDNPAEIAPPERTLRPYDVPMLPFESDAEAQEPIVDTEPSETGRDPSDAQD